MSFNRTFLSKHIKSHSKGIAIFLCIFLYAIFSLINIRSPGLHYDETLFVNAALGGIDQSFILLEKWHVPIMLMPYMGALKSYIFAPIFLIFGVSFLTIRIPCILITCFSLFLIFSTIKKATGNFTISITSLALLCTDASLISFTRTDVGPNVLELLCKSLLLYLFFQILQKTRVRTVALFSTALLLGTFNKLNFIWVINSFIAAGIVYWKMLIKKLTKLKRRICIGGVFFSYTLFLLIFFGLKNKDSFPSASIAQSIEPKISGIWSFLDQSLYGDYLGYSSAITSFPLYRTTMMAILLLGTFLGIKNRTKLGKFTRFNAIFLFTILFQILITPRATAGWHFFALFPSFQIYLAICLYVISAKTIKVLKFQSTNIHRLSFLFMLFPLSFNIFKCTELVINRNSIVGNTTWSTSIYDLISYTKSSPRFFISTDWGIHNQLLISDVKKGKYTDLWASFLKDNSSQEEISWMCKTFFETDVKYAFITKGDTLLTFPKTKENLFKMATTCHSTLFLEKRVFDGKTAIFEIYTPLAISKKDPYFKQDKN